MRMRLRIKDMDIATGGILIAILNQKDAKRMDIHSGDRVLIKNGKRSTTVVLDVAESAKAVPPGKVGVFEELIDALHLDARSEVDIFLQEKPDSVRLIRKKLYGFTLTPKEMHAIVQDVVDNKLTDIELTYFIAAGYTRGLNLKETVCLAKEMIRAGETLDLKQRPIFDKHCIGGVAGNRTTPIVVPMLAAAGLTVPKTSSRAITSPAGTADTMEVLTDVCLDKARIQKVVNKVGACLVWGGAVNLAPADDKFITVEYPMGIDSEGQLLASVLAKKGSVGATHVLIDIPVGKGAKIKTSKEAQHMSRKFHEVGEALGMKIHTIMTDGRQPIGNGIGPAMEARDVLFVLKNDERAPQDLREKCIYMAAEAFKMHSRIKNPAEYAREMLDSGAAYKKMLQIIRAQGEKITNPDRIRFAKYSFDYCAPKTGKIVDLDNKPLARAARAAGAPLDIAAGMFMHKHLGDAVKRNEPIFTLYAHSEEKLEFAKDFMKKFGGVRIR